MFVECASVYATKNQPQTTGHGCSVDTIRDDLLLFVKSVNDLTVGKLRKIRVATGKKQHDFTIFDRLSQHLREIHPSVYILSIDKIADTCLIESRTNPVGDGRILSRITYENIILHTCFKYVTIGQKKRLGRNIFNHYSHSKSYLTKYIHRSESLHSTVMPPAVPAVSPPRCPAP